MEPSKRTSKTATPKTPSKATPKTPPKASPKPATDASPRSTSKVAENVTETTAEATPQPQKKEKKRKRAPSPDVIPNPPGCSYGMDMDYFYYDLSDFEDEEMDSPSREEHKDTSAAPKSAIRNAEQTIAPPSKKVRFDASPQDSPSKVRSRARATDPYTGGHFVGVGEESPTSAQTDHPGTAPSPGTPSAASSRAMAAQHTTHTPATGPAAVPGTTPTSGPMHAAGTTAAPGLTGASGATVAPAPTAAAASPAGPSPTTAPTPETPRLTDTLTGQSAAPSPVAAPDHAAPEPARYDPLTMLPVPESVADLLHSDQAPTGRSTTSPPSDTCPAAPTTPTKPEDEVVAKARSQVEKFKPKTPSTLRTACHNSSPLTMSPELFSHLRRSLDFGEDQAGRDAQWLYELCPSGNIEELKWPSKQKVTDGLNVDPKPRQILTKTWNNLEVDDNHSLFCEMVKEEF